jgi:hypothetical protein
MRDDIGLAQDSLDRQREVEEAFLALYRTFWRPIYQGRSIGGYAQESDWATIAREMGITSFYKRLKEGK